MHSMYIFFTDIFMSYKNVTGNKHQLYLCVDTSKQLTKCQNVQVSLQRIPPKVALSPDSH